MIDRGYTDPVELAPCLHCGAPIVYVDEIAITGPAHDEGCSLYYAPRPKNVNRKDVSVSFMVGWIEGQIEGYDISTGEFATNNEYVRDFLNGHYPLLRAYKDEALRLQKFEALYFTSN